MYPIADISGGVWLLDRPPALLVMPPGLVDDVFGAQEQDRLAALVRWAAAPVSSLQVREHPELLSGVELLVTGWGGPVLDHELLSHAPCLRAVFHGAGSVRPVTTDAFWARGIPIVSAAAANAVPVAEFTAAHVTLALKHAHRYERHIRAVGSFPPLWPVPGGYGSTVGIVSLGLIGRMVAQRLSTHDVHIIAADPYAREEVSAALGVEVMGLRDLFLRADVITVHTPLLAGTMGLISGELLASMRHGATIINTSRGAVIDESALIRVLETRDDLLAILDVTRQEPPAAGSPLYTLPNVILTPHIAGSLGLERRRIGQLIVEEITRFTAGQPLHHEVTAAGMPFRA